MFLKEIALKWADEPMEAWDAVTETWVPDSFMARIDLTDRFLSNFNKPTRRRMLFADNKVVFPESRTFRHPGTHEVYILGTTRQDALAGKPYIGLTICQLVTDVPGGSAGLATITRKVVQGPPDNPGWLVDTVFARAFIDTEFLTSNDEVETTDLRIERYNAYLPLQVQPQEWDFIEFHGNKYRVLDTFADSGFFALRIDHERDYRTDFILHVGGKRVMDRATNQYTQGTASFNVTGVMEKESDVALWTTDSDKYLTVYFERDHLPFGIDITGKDVWLEVKGVKRQVKAVTTQAGERQYQLRVL
ncbi:hypothetical protein uan_057 [Pseudomonas phage UAntarctica]|nr:hypothetical protein uan_057 [Pseudomonas phage UAntarctica]